MSKIVFVLGAGASVHCGIPLMKDFIRVSADLFKAGEVEEAKADFELVLDAIGKLRGMIPKANLDLRNIEIVYTAFEMGQLLERLPGIDNVETIESLAPSMRKLIGHTLEHQMKLYDRGETKAPIAYHQFSGILDRLIQNKTDFSVITFNYDLGLDYSLYAKKIAIDYGIGDIPLTGKKQVNLFKLHGSLNWGRCTNDDCEKLTAYRGFQNTTYCPNEKSSTLPVLSRLKTMKCEKCGSSIHEDPVLIPPTWNKTSFHSQIEQVWRGAANALKDAEHIFVLGYSLPDTDWFFDYLFALGVDMTTIVNQFCVVNPDNAVAERFKRFLGPDVTGRIVQGPTTFEEFVSKSNTLWPTPNSPNIIPIINW
ncbi:hypothetical protein ACFLXU_05445 [Chloroflexota bacterium]